MVRYFITESDAALLIELLLQRGREELPSCDLLLTSLKELQCLRTDESTPSIRLIEFSFHFNCVFFFVPLLRRSISFLTFFSTKLEDFYYLVRVVVIHNSFVKINYCDTVRFSFYLSHLPRRDAVPACEYVMRESNQWNAIFIKMNRFISTSLVFANCWHRALAAVDTLAQ